MAAEFSDLFHVKDKIRGPIVDGIFYPDDDRLLKEEIRFLLEEVDDPPGQSFGIIVPHAALPFSGSLAAVAFKAAAERKVENVVIIATVHREEQDAVFLTESESFTIPTGNMKVNRTIIEKLRKSDPCFQINDLPHLEEHSIEVQLPFIRFLFPEANIVPILLGSNNVDLIKTVSGSLESVFGNEFGRTLFVVSANMSSYLPAKEAREFCEKMVKIVEEGDLGSLYKEIKSGNNNMKELGCVAILLSLAGSGSSVKVLRKKDSSKYGCENDNIVCYAAITVEKAG